MRISILLLMFISFSAMCQEDCIFNNEYKELGEKWIRESETDYDFRWVEEANIFIAKLNKEESLQLSKGGCNSFGTSLVFSTTADKSFEDVEFWMSKALELSKQFKLELFSEPLLEKTYSESYRNERLVIFSFPKKQEYDNRITEGIVVEKKENSMNLELSYYVN